MVGAFQGTFRAWCLTQAGGIWEWEEVVAGKESAQNFQMAHQAHHWVYTQKMGDHCIQEIPTPPGFCSPVHHSQEKESTKESVVG